MYIFIFPALGYLIGSISAAIVVSRMLGVSDPRQSGSGNPGTTNVLRLGGKKAAAITLLGDVLKGVLPVAVAATVAADAQVIALTALGCLLGHLYPLYYGFKGGKGVATAIGVYLGMAPLIGLAVVALWLAVAGITRYSSAASLSAMAAAPVLAGVISGDAWLVAAAAVIFTLVAFSHKDNIRRLLAGKEDKINLRG